MRRQTVLIASSDVYQTKFLQEWLGNAGYRTLVSPRGCQALEAIRKEKPDLLVLEWKLPDLSGLALVRMIRAEEGSIQMPIILLGGMSEEDRLLGLEAGADLCAEETLHARVFIARVRALIRRSSFAQALW